MSAVCVQVGAQYFSRQKIRNVISSETSVSVVMVNFTEIIIEYIERKLLKRNLEIIFRRIYESLGELQHNSRRRVAEQLFFKGDHSYFTAYMWACIDDFVNLSHLTAKQICILSNGADE